MRNDLLRRRTFMASGAAATALFGSRLAASDAVAGPTLKELADSKGLSFGTATSPEELADEGYAALIARECSAIVGENDYKWKQIERVRGRPDFSRAAAIARFASNKGMRLRGHCFIWNQDNRIPAWQLENEAELARNGGEGLIKALWDHAGALATNFPQITSWDAVNEMITPGKGDIRNSLLTRILGNQALDIGFAIMRAKLPDVELVYNDYMCWEKYPTHRVGVLRMLEQALSRGVPIDALGIQSHLAASLAIGHDEAQWRKFLEEVQAMGLKVLITELDCGDRGISAQGFAERDMEVAAFTKGYLDLTLSFENVKQVVLWSISDRGSYLNRPYTPIEQRRADGLPMRGHPYDEDFRPKPMRTAIAAALASAPKRNTPDSEMPMPCE